MALVVQSVLCVDVMLKLKILNTSSLFLFIFILIYLYFHIYSIQRFKLFNNINKVDLSFTQLNTKEQVNILLYGYPPNQSNALNQDIIKFVINFLKKFGRFHKPLISFNHWFYALLFFFLIICSSCVIIFFVRK